MSRALGKKRASNPGMKFFLAEENVATIELPEEINGIHSLSRFLLNKFLGDRGYSTTPEGKRSFITEVLSNKSNKQFSPEEAFERLSLAIVSVFDIKKTTEDHPINTRERRHVEYGIQKELESLNN